MAKNRVKPIHIIEIDNENNEIENDCSQDRNPGRTRQVEGKNHDSIETCK